MSENEFKRRISKYSLIELGECLSGLDSEKYPERHLMLREAIAVARQRADSDDGSPLPDAPCIEFAGFWRRLASYFIDLLVLSPYMVLSSYLANKFLYYYIYSFLPSLAIGIAFGIILVARYGGTPGKLIMKIKINMLDGSKVTLKAAVLRYLPLLTLSSIVSFAFVVSCSRIREEVYYSLGFLDKNKLLIANAPDWYGVAHFSMNIWIWAEFITLLFNKRKRSIHDYIAGTIVLRSSNQNANMPAAQSHSVKQDFPTPLSGAGS